MRLVAVVGPLRRVRRGRRRSASSATSSRRPTTCPTRSPPFRTPIPHARPSPTWRPAGPNTIASSNSSSGTRSGSTRSRLACSKWTNSNSRCWTPASGGAEITRVKNLRGLPREFWQTFMKCYMDEVVAIVSEPGIVGACSVDEIRGMQQLYNEQGFERVIWVELNVVPKESTQRMLERIQQAAPAPGCGTCTSVWTTPSCWAPPPTSRSSVRPSISATSTTPTKGNARCASISTCRSWRRGRPAASRRKSPESRRRPNRQIPRRTSSRRRSQTPTRNCSVTSRRARRPTRWSGASATAR